MLKRESFFNVFQVKSMLIFLLIVNVVATLKRHQTNWY